MAKLTKDELEFIWKNVSFGYATHEDFPNLAEGEAIPWVAVPNMPNRPPFSLQEIQEALTLRNLE